MGTGEVSANGPGEAADLNARYATVLRRLRLQANFTSADLANKAGVDERVIEDIEAGIQQGPSDTSWQALMAVLDPSHLYDASTDSGCRQAIDDLGMAASSRAISGGGGPGSGSPVQASQALAAPVRVPSQQQPEVRFVRTDLFDRLEEHRSNEKNWTTEAGLFIGATLGVFANAATSGTMGPATWVLAAAFVLMAGFLSFHAWEERRRGAQARREMIAEAGPHAPPV